MKLSETLEPFPLYLLSLLWLFAPRAARAARDPETLGSNNPNSALPGSRKLRLCKRAKGKMHGFQTTWVMLFGIVITVAATSTDGSPALLNFRPFNVTLSSLYFWVGSYFNGTAHFEFSPYAGLAASETAGCPVLRNKTITKDYKALLALTEPAIYNTANDPVNAFLTLWPLGFDFGTMPGSYITFDMLDSLEYAVYSSDPNFANDTTIIPNNFNWTLEKTQAPPYSLNSALTDYQGTYPEQDGADDSIQVNSTIANCSGTEVSSWQFTPLSYNSTYNGTNFTDPVISIQFDGQTANLSMKGYASAVSEYKTGSAYQVGSVTFAGEFTLTFSGVIDLYHSDVLRNDMATPTWLRTVGYQNNSLNVGYTSGSAGGQLVGSWSLAMIMVLSQMWLSFC